MITGLLMDGGTLNMLILKYNIEYQNTTSFSYEHPNTSSSLPDCLFEKMREYLIVVEVSEDEKTNLENNRIDQNKAGS